jgi:hypothetical protein
MANFIGAQTETAEKDIIVFYKQILNLQFKCQFKS